MKSTNSSKTLSMQDWAEQEYGAYRAKLDRLQKKHPWLRFLNRSELFPDLYVKDVFMPPNHRWGDLKTLSYQHLEFQFFPFVPFPEKSKLKGRGFGFDVISKINLRKKTFTIPEFSDSQIWYQNSYGHYVHTDDWYQRRYVQPFFIAHSERVMQALIDLTRSLDPLGFTLIKKTTNKSYRYNWGVDELL